MYLADAGHYVLADANVESVPRIAAFLTQPRPYSWPSSRK